MISENTLKNIIAEVLTTMDSADAAPAASDEPRAAASCEVGEDLAAVDLRKQLLVPEPNNREAYLKMKATTPARIGIWRTGARYLTGSSLRFRADHAVAQDAVFNNVCSEFIKDWGLLELKTQCADKDEYLTRPDLGRKLDADSIAKAKAECKMNPTVQFVVIDGLSSTAIETNAKDTMAAALQGLKNLGIECGTPFFVRYARVPSMDSASEVTQPQVTVALVGERPGLATGESMSAYMVYQCREGISESKRTIISNIHKGGTPAVEAGAQIADIVKKMLEQKASGIDLQI
ncbi:ethanolamine ammonia-lyase subunit EutC [Desulfoluna butyratoxydans]|uniref:Ethanolamine ammonia-lyase small subunit n=1 Tax=Desulfoluna butyratoxydans TaxID=231438 RepID=A0A4U8YMN6_9BACT|nr:ethanolamine ammonia-lyase subunit EutC [Desulfoluna butyratoxydans]VFQ45020.1 ethanolamine ammonia-lyase light chain [Desulfoluna butyratoxydans]